MANSTPSPFVQARPQRAHELIVAQLEQLILSGQMPPGSRLPSEREMMVDFQVSRPTVREALRVAESMGLIAVRPGDPAGAKVLGAPSLGVSRLLECLLRAGQTNAQELIELRILVESASAVQLCARPRRQLGPLRELYQKMCATEELRPFAALDAQFHRSLIEAGGNRLFLLIFESLLEPIEALIEHSLDEEDAQSRRKALRHHAAIVAAVEKRDATAADEAVRKHLCDFHQGVLSGKTPAGRRP